MKPAPFTYHRARTTAGAVELLTELGDDAKVIAGGQSLVAMMNFRLARPEHLIDITRIEALSGIRREGDALHVGALTTHRAVERADLGRDFRILSDAMAHVGHLPIRTRGTVGGSIAHADAAAEWCLLAVLLDALIVTEGPAGRREIAAEDFFLGPFTTALDADELIVELVFPRPAPRSALTEYAERKGDFAIVAAALDLDGGSSGHGRAVLGGVAATPVSIELDSGPVARSPGFDDLHLRDEDGVSAHYRRGLVRTLVTRAHQEASHG